MPGTALVRFTVPRADLRGACITRRRRPCIFRPVGGFNNKVEEGGGVLVPKLGGGLAAEVTVPLVII